MSRALSERVCQWHQGKRRHPALPNPIPSFPRRWAEISKVGPQKRGHNGLGRADGGIEGQKRNAKAPGRTAGSSCDVLDFQKTLGKASNCLLVCPADRASACSRAADHLVHGLPCALARRPGLKGHEGAYGGRGEYGGRHVKSDRVRRDLSRQRRNIRRRPPRNEANRACGESPNRRVAYRPMGGLETHGDPDHLRHGGGRRARQVRLLRGGDRDRIDVR